MRKNRFLTIAGCLMVLCLLTTCVIGTTFAKYVTGGSTSDQARVARWGVELDVAADDEFFSNNYTNGAGIVTVKSTSDKLVAPGTKQHTAARFAISGAPEVSVRVTVDLAIWEEVVLYKNVPHLNYTTANDLADTFTLDYDYYPVIFTLTQVTAGGAPVNVEIARGNLTTIKNALDSYNSTAVYAPNTDLEASFELTWEWAFAGDDRADTYLANQAAGTETDGVYNTKISFGITITVEQVD